MRNCRFVRLAMALLPFIAVILGPVQASHAAPVTLTLTQTTGTITVSDAAGSTFHSGGTVSVGSTVVGRFARTLRVVTGVTEPQNTALVTINLIGLGAAPSQNVILVGTHDFATGNQIGGIGASSILGLTGFTWSAALAGGSSNTLILNLP